MKVRKHLSADGLFKMVKKEFKKVKDHRPINVEIPLEDALMSGFALFSLYTHQMLGGALVHPERREVIPLAPEPIIKQDGAKKNDCERNAAKRFLAKLRQGYP
ncbi:MAG: hypothetical protein GY796_16195, partial [Chloroflexi bacterium]|nr:hypothetical protein [Chloroflexota bacterium]